MAHLFVRTRFSVCVGQEVFWFCDGRSGVPYISCKVDSVLIYFWEAVVMCILSVGMHDTEDVVCSFCLIEQRSQTSAIVQVSFEMRCWCDLAIHLSKI